MKTTPTKKRERPEGVIYADELLEQQFPGYHKELEADIKRMMAPGYHPIVCTGGFLFPPPPMLRSRARRIPTFDEETERFLEEEFDRWFPTKTKKRHLPLLEQRDIAIRETLGLPGRKRNKKRTKNRRTAA